MAITRRCLLAGAGASLAVAALPASATEPLLYVALEGAVFRRSRRRLAGWEFILGEVQNSVWQFDDQTYEDRTLVRHCPSALTYLASRERAGSIAVQRIATECCPRLPGQASYDVVGHAARVVAAHMSRNASALHFRHRGAVFIFYPAPDKADAWPDTPPLTEDAPPLLVKSLADYTPPFAIAYEREPVLGA